ncbi:MAG: monofunctional biosynthetic peptidoglycan transglycosylase [Deltaproteobacteria bacterium]|nr:monofunctional biosynthetic peptidoglycan transglycosylase [Deltaproteobacteria bacterium]
MFGKNRKIRKNSRASFWRRGFLLLLLALLLVTGLEVFVFGSVRPPLTVAAARARMALLLGREVFFQPQSWVSLQEISPHLRRAVLASEDQRFLRHRGFDFIELGLALQALQEGGALRGASTISMQTARTLFLWPARSWWRKFAEAYYTLLLELVWSKEKILEFYLNSVDWGPGVCGVEAAALKYFHCHARALDADQSALLAAVLPGPHLWRPDRPNDAVKRRVARIRQEMGKVPLVGEAPSM